MRSFYKSVLIAALTIFSVAHFAPSAWAKEGSIMPSLCASQLPYVMLELKRRYDLSFIPVAGDSNTYTSGVFAINPYEQSIIILREVTQNYTVIIGQMIFSGKRAYCILGGFRPLTKADTL